MPRVGLDEAAVIDAAASIADAEGLDAVTLARIAELVGVRPPSLYKHVDGLGGVISGLALRGVLEAQKRIAQATVGRSGDAALFAMAEAYWQFAHDHPGLYAASTVAASEENVELANAASHLLDTVLAVLRGYDLDGEDALHAVRAVRAIVHGFVDLEARGGFGMPLDVEESFNRLVATFAKGLHDRRPTTAK
jgi:AcrR family transcriptional regulator